MFDSLISQIMLALYAGVGVMALEWAWHKFRRFRNPNKELNELYPGFRRDDCSSWQKWKFYPGAVLVLIPRFLLFSTAPIIVWVCFKLATIGHKLDTPLTGIRKAVVHNVLATGARVMMFCVSTRVKVVNLTAEQVDHYREYLGSPEEQSKCQKEETADDARVPKRGPGAASTIVCNHTGWIDVLALVSTYLHPAFAAREESKNAPILGDLCRVNQDLFIARGGTQKERDLVIS